MTMTEFNRNPSLAARLARADVVTITDRGKPSLELRSVRADDPFQDLRRAGLVRPPVRKSSQPFPPQSIEPALAMQIIDELAGDRERRDY